MPKNTIEIPNVMPRRPILLPEGDSDRVARVEAIDTKSANHRKCKSPQEQITTRANHHKSKSPQAQITITNKTEATRIFTGTQGKPKLLCKVVFFVEFWSISV